MPAYGLPGVTAGPNRALATGVVAALVVVAATFGWNVYDADRSTGEIDVQLRTAAIGDGVVPGAEVRLSGIDVGRIDAIAGQPDGHQLITLSLKQSQLFGLTDSFDVDYAPANLFGISELTLKRRPGGNPLESGALVDLTAAGRVTDSTLGKLLRQLSDTATEVLTPEVTELLTRTATDLTAFTPLLRAVVDVGRAVAESQRYPSSFLIEQYASFFNGVGVFADGTIRLVDQIYNIDVLRNDRARFDIGVGLVVDGLFPAISDLGWTLKGHVANYAASFTPLLLHVAGMVPTPQRSSAQIGEILDRLTSAFRDSPQGPVLGVDVALRGVPGLAVPLLQGIPVPNGGGR